MLCLQLVTGVDAFYSLKWACVLVLHCLLGSHYRAFSMASSSFLVIRGEMTVMHKWCHVLLLARCCTVHCLLSRETSVFIQQDRRNLQNKFTDNCTRRILCKTVLCDTIFFCLSETIQCWEWSYIWDAKAKAILFMYWPDPGHCQKQWLKPRVCNWKEIMCWDEPPTGLSLENLCVRVRTVCNGQSHVRCRVWV